MIQIDGHDIREVLRFEVQERLDVGEAVLDERLRGGGVGLQRDGQGRCGLCDLVLHDDGGALVLLDVDLPAGELGRQAGVLAALADGE